MRKTGRDVAVRCLLALLGLGCSKVGCNIKATEPALAALDAGQPVPVEKVTVNAASAPGAEVAWLLAMRKRDWATAAREIVALYPIEPREPKMRLVLAYALSKDAKFDQALPLLTDLEKELPLLRSQITRLRAEVSLGVPQAASLGAAWLATQGEPRAYARAAKTYFDARQFDLALACAKRAVDLLATAKDEPSRTAYADARAIRARVLTAEGDTTLAAQDWLWLAVLAPLQVAALDADLNWEAATGQKLSAEQRMNRALAFAKAGMLEPTEHELERLQKISHVPLAPGYSDWLLGKARSKAHVEHAEGAHMLERSVSAHVEDADSLRLDAARLYMRAGLEQNSIRILETMIRAKSPRSREARALLARAHSMLGNYPAALRIYDSMLGKDKPKGKEDLGFEQAVMELLAGQPARALVALDVIAQTEMRESLRARTAELAAVAALEADHREDAIARFRAVITQYPFTLGAWLASDRLKQLGLEPVLPPIPEASPVAAHALSVEIPAVVALLHELGLDDFAAKVLADQEAPLRTRYGASAGEMLCDGYGLLGVAERRYAWSREAVGNLDLTKAPDAATRWRWDCRFPRPYVAVTGELEQQWQLPMGLLSAVMRQESSFRTKVLSPAGAVGLTQVMPNTAKRLIKEFGSVPACTANDTPALDEPRCNLELGARYLHKLMTLFDGQLPLAILSYNAGPDVVSHWLAEKKPMPLDLFLAKVPFTETRNYVHHVLTNFLVYSWLTQQKVTLPNLEWKPTVAKLEPADLY